MEIEIKTGNAAFHDCADICHLCESRREAEELARKWNEAYRQNGTNLF